MNDSQKLSINAFINQERFKIGPCSFHHLENESPFSHLQRMNFYDDSRVERLDRIFKNVGLQNFDVNKRQILSADYKHYGEIYSNINPPDEGCLTWYCYHTASFISMKETKEAGPWKRLFFGLTTQKVKKEFLAHTMLHTWNSSDEGDFIDAQIQAKCEDELELCNLMKARGRWLNLERPRVTLEDFHTYSGIEMPVVIAESIFGHNPDSQGNLWGYMIKRILISDEKTDWFIDVLRNGGRGWMYEGAVS